MSLVLDFQKNILQQNLFTSKDKLLLAVSGGVDSVVLCELCKQSWFDFMIAHCNFQLRGEESERDEQFVKELGKKYAVEVLVKKFDTEKYAAENKLSTQEAARELRYNWFLNTVNDLKLKKDIQHSSFNIYLLTAHHADDNTETVLMNFFRGTGLHGLTGIPAANNYIRRPLLPFTKEELIKFASKHALSYVEDSSNQSSKYTRNFFRNELIPAISNVYPQVNENLQDNITRFKEIEILYQLGVAAFKKKLCRQKNEELHIPVKQLMGYKNKALIYEIIKDFGFTEKQVEEVEKLAASDSGKFIISPAHTHRIIKHRHWFIISLVSTTEALHIIIEQGVKQLKYQSGLLKIEEVVNCNLQIPVSSSIACVDIKEITFPLLLRKWKTGDYFYPLGMKKKKKLARFFIDQKLSKTEKENVWVIESNKRITWVVGLRLDERFKVQDSTKKMLRFTVEK